MLVLPVPWKRYTPCELSPFSDHDNMSREGEKTEGSSVYLLLLTDMGLLDVASPSSETGTEAGG